MPEYIAKVVEVCATLDPEERAFDAGEISTDDVVASDGLVYSPGRSPSCPLDRERAQLPEFELTSNFSSIPRMAPPPWGRITAGRVEVKPVGLLLAKPEEETECRGCAGA